MTAGQENLARTLLDILGEDKLLEIVDKDRLADQLGLEGLLSMLDHLQPQVAGFDKEQRLRVLRSGMNELSE